MNTGHSVSCIAIVRTRQKAVGDDVQHRIFILHCSAPVFIAVHLDSAKSYANVALHACHDHMLCWEANLRLCNLLLCLLQAPFQLQLPLFGCPQPGLQLQLAWLP